MSLRKLRLALIGFMVALLGVAVTAQPSYAAGATACITSPSPANCDGLDAGLPDNDPSGNGGSSCLPGSYQVGQSVGYPFIPWLDSDGSVRVQLWWSPRCRSNWARVVQVIETPETGWFLIGIQRKPCSGCALDFPMNDYGHLTGVGSAWISPMLYANNIQARAGITEGSTWQFGEWY